MKVAAYCACRWILSTWRTVGVRPITCPPVNAVTLDMEWLKAPVIYLRLHGVEGQPYLYGDHMETAVSARQIRGADLGGSLVFLEGCYGLQMADAFLKAGSLAVVGRDRPTGGRRMLLGSGARIGRAWLQGIKRGMTCEEALKCALSKIGQKHRPGWAIAGNKQARLV